MSELDTPHGRLADLRRRWLMDPDSRLFLQLAEEYRRLGRYEEAIDVLEQGLKRRPSDLSGMVALGRCRLESGKVEAAVSLLEAVIQRDQAHIVANKLLLEAYLQQGDPDKARGRLDLYRLLNDRDPELKHLEYRLRQLASEGRKAQTAVDPPELVLEELLGPRGAGARRGPEGAGSEEVAMIDSESPTVNLGQDSLARAVAAADATLQAEANGDLRNRPDPFTGLPAPSLNEHWRALSQEGIFELRASEAEPVELLDELAESSSAASVPMTSEIDLEGLAEEKPDASTSGIEEDAGIESIEAEPAKDPRPAALAAESRKDPGEARSYDPGEETAVGLLGSLGALAAGAAAGGAAAALGGSDSEELSGESVADLVWPRRMPSDQALDAAAVVESPGSLPAEGKPEEEARPVGAPAEPGAASEVASVEGRAESLASEETSPSPASLPPSSTPATAELELDTFGPLPEATAKESAEPTAVTQLSDLLADEIVKDAKDQPGEAGGHGTAPTATLARLYQEQGHDDEAEEIYRQILDGDPSNVGALEGLRRLEAKKTVTASSLLPASSVPEGVTPKKIFVLRAYLDRIRNRKGENVH